MMSRIAVAISLALLAAPLAQAQDAAAGGSSMVAQLIMFLPLILIFYFLLIRPANQRQKKHRAMVEAVVRGDTIVTTGGLIGKVAKVTETELSVDLAEGVRVRVVKGMIADVRGKGDVVPANDTKPA